MANLFRYHNLTRSRMPMDLVIYLPARFLRVSIHPVVLYVGSSMRRSNKRRINPGASRNSRMTADILALL